MLAFTRAEKGIPIGRPAEVNLRNNHTQYIFTWYVVALKCMYCSREYGLTNCHCQVCAFLRNVNHALDGPQEAAVADLWQGPPE